jgi:hypothetical protein
VLFSAVSLYGVLRVLRLQHSGVRVPGVVVGEATSHSQNGFTLHHPVVRYAIPDGQQVEDPSARGTVFRRARTGEQVVVRYDLADPGHMLLSEDGPQPVFWIFSTVGFMICAVGVVVLFALLT